MTGNLFGALRAAFPSDLDSTAIETADTREPLRYTWLDLERGTAMLANLFDSLALPPDSRIAVQVDKSVEALMLYLAVLRAGHVYLPLNSAYQAAADPAPDPAALGRAVRDAVVQGFVHTFGFERAETLASLP